MTAEVVVVMTTTEAEWVTNRIRNAVTSLRVGFDELEAAVIAAKTGSAHVALGYASWTAYLSDVLGREPLRLDATERRELVAYLSGQGMSTRAIAPIVGVSHKTVAQDVQVSPEVTPAQSVDTETGEITEPTTGGEVAAEPTEPTAPLAPSPVVTGLDGKAYSKPPVRPASAKPASPRRSALVDQARNTGWELDRITSRLERIAEDDRLPAQKDEVASQMRSHLAHAIEVCQDLLDRINN